MKKDTLPSVKFYDGIRTVSEKDRNNKKPGMIVVCGNRTSGKTTFYNTYVLNKILKKKIHKFVYLVRYKYELETVASQFYEPIGFRYPHLKIEQGKIKQGSFCELFADGRSIGYGMALAGEKTIKKESNKFNSVDLILWDEFQSSDNRYLPEEMVKFESCYISIARGGGKAVRDVQVIAISNFISLLNPLMSTLEAQRYLKPNTKFYHGDGFIIEQNINTDVIAQQENNQVIRALSKTSANYLGLKDKEQVKYLIDNGEKYGILKGRNVYLCTFKYKNEEYAIRFYHDEGLYHVNQTIDKLNKNTVAASDGEINFKWIRFNNPNRLRAAFETGRFRFQDVRCRDALINLIKY